MKYKFYLIYLLFFAFSCEPAQDFKGEIIPDKKFINNLLSSEQGQNLQVISYLNQIIDEGSPSHLYYLRAKYLYEIRQYKKANVDIQHSLKLAPRDFDYLLLAGKIALDLENYNLALHYFNLIRSGEKRQSFILFLLAEVSIKIKKNVLAINYLNQISSHELSTKNRLYYSILRQLNSINQDSSINLWNGVDEISLQDVRLQRFYFDHALGNTSKYLYQNQLLKAMNDYPNDPHLIRFWARFLNQINQFKMAELAYQKAANLFEANELLYLEIGIFYMQRRNYSSALNYFEKIKFDKVLFTEVPFLKSKCYLYLGDKIHYKSTLDSFQILLKNDARFYQLKIKYFGVSVDSTFVKNDSLIKIRP
jgi:tetratricopeptide (TPR) repeat protein